MFRFKSVSSAATSSDAMPWALCGTSHIRLNKYSVAERSSLARPLPYQRPRLLSQAEHLPVEIESASSSFGLPYDAVGVGIQDAHEGDISDMESAAYPTSRSHHGSNMCVLNPSPHQAAGQGKLQRREVPDQRLV